jgi:hypothetical protein
MSVVLLGPTWSSIPTGMIYLELALFLISQISQITMAELSTLTDSMNSMFAVRRITVQPFLEELLSIPLVVSIFHGI